MIAIEIAFANAKEQCILGLKVPEGSTVYEAITASGIQNQFSDIDFKHMPVGIFSRKASFNDVVQDGDRIEIYRPLTIDPKERRREKLQF